MDCLKKKIITANDISNHMDYINHKAMMQKGSYPEGQVEKWIKEFDDFRKKEYVSTDDLIDNIKEIKKSLDRSKKFKQEFIDLVKEKSKKQKIPDEIVIHYDFQMW